MDSAGDQIPVTLLTGFLGSGKTTTLNHLMRQPAFADVMVIINEFGEVALDHLLIGERTENLVMEMSSGCLCCNIRGDLVKTLSDLSWRFSRNGERQFNRVVIETTGVADPAPIVQSLMADPAVASKYRLDGLVATVDLATGMGTLNEFTEATRQVAMADTLLLTKRDLVTDEQRDLLLRRIEEINPAAERVEVQDGQVAPEQVLDLGLVSSDGKLADVAAWLREEAYPGSAAHDPEGHKAFRGHDHCGHEAHDHGHGAHGQSGHADDQDGGQDGDQDGDKDGDQDIGIHHDHAHDVNRHDEHIRAFCFTIDDPIPEDVVGPWLEVMMGFVGADILRVKGILNVAGHEQPVAVHGVQHILHPPATLSAWPSEDQRSRLVFITRDIGPEEIEETFQAFSQPPDRAWGAA